MTKTQLTRVVFNTQPVGMKAPTLSQICKAPATDDGVLSSSDEELEVIGTQ